MKPQVEWVTHIIRQENKYDSLPPKAVNKILYLVNKRCDERGVEATVPYFWYMFGVMTEEGAGDGPLETPAEPTSPDGVSQFDNEEAEPLREIVREVLQEYYETGVEGITDKTYRDAPYSVQQEWRKLDKMLRTHHDEYNDFFEVNPSWDEIWDAVDAVYESFPAEEFPEHEMDFVNWYSIMARELNSHEPDEEFLMDANLAFWKVFSISIAKKHRYEVSTEEIADIIDVPSLDDSQRTGRDDLLELETKALTSKFQGTALSPGEERACDAVSSSALAVTLEEAE